MKKPVIAVTPLWDETRESIWMLPGYLDGLRTAGAVPVILPLEADQEDIGQLAGLCDGLLLTGGQDVDPALYGQAREAVCAPPCRRRDSLDAALFRLFHQADKPILGICRGAQLVNVLMGGTLYQDLPSQLPGALPHVMQPPYDRAVHTVQLTPGGLLEGIVGQRELGVNSYHHQGIHRLAPSLTAEAVAPDGLVEAVSCRDRAFLLAVQWHPEFSFRADEASRAIFRAFVESCA